MFHQHATVIENMTLANDPTPRVISQCHVLNDGRMLKKNLLLLK